MPFPVRVIVGCSFACLPHSPSIEMRVEVYKDLVMDAEGFYLAFPLQVEGGRWYLDKAGAFLDLQEHLPGHLL